MKICWTQILLWITIGTLALGAALSAGCGQKGPLFLPSDTAKKQKKKSPDLNKDQTKNQTDDDKDKK